MGGAVCGRQALLGPLRGEALVHYGGVISPFNAWLIMRGMATLPLRMREHGRNAVAVADFLSNHPAVTKVIFPGHMTGEARRRADAVFTGWPVRSCSASS